MGSKIGDVTLPFDAKVWVGKDKLKVDKLILSNIRPITVEYEMLIHRYVAACDEEQTRLRGEYKRYADSIERDHIWEMIVRTALTWRGVEIRLTIMRFKLDGKEPFDWVRSLINMYRGTMVWSEIPGKIRAELLYWTLDEINSMIDHLQRAENFHLSMEGVAK